MLLIDAISSELIGAAVETTVWTSRQTDHGACPGDPWSGSLTSMIDAPPASAVRASSADRTLTSNCATGSVSGSRRVFWVERCPASRQQAIGSLEDRIQSKQDGGARQVGQNRRADEKNTGDVAGEQSGEVARIGHLGDQPGSKVAGQEEESRG